MNVTQDDFQAYVTVQELGITNMFAINTVSDLTGLSKEKILDIMTNYGKYKKAYSEKEYVSNNI